MLVVKNHHHGKKVVNIKFFARVFFYTQGPFRVHTVMFRRIWNWCVTQYLNSDLALALHSRPWSWLYWLCIRAVLLGAYTVLLLWLC